MTTIKMVESTAGSPGPYLAIQNATTSREQRSTFGGRR